MDLLVGTFNTTSIYTLRFTPPATTSHPSPSSATAATLKILHRTPAIGSHSWLALNTHKTHLYATAWTDPPSVAAYRLERVADGSVIPLLLDTADTTTRSGYVCVSDRALYSAGGPSGEVFSLEEDGSVGACLQKLSFVDAEAGSGGHGEARPHGDFGGLRHGAHSADLSPDGRLLFVADIGRNCVWSFVVDDKEGTVSADTHAGQEDGTVKVLAMQKKHVAPRANDGPRHTTVHPNGKVLYSLQEHSCMVDVFDVTPSAGASGEPIGLTHRSGRRIIPEDKDEKEYWADEVRVSASGDGKPRYLYASARGLKRETMGYLAVFAMDEEGNIKGEALQIWETPTSGGWANAVEPAPMPTADAEVEYMALTDSEEGWVFVLAFDGKQTSEVARCKLEPDEEGEVVGAATAVWL